MQNSTELVEKLAALLDAERDLRDALEEYEGDLDAELPDSLDSLDAALAKVLRSKRWSCLLRELRRPGVKLAPSGADVGQYFERR